MADGSAGLTIVPVPLEIMSLQVIGPPELRLTLPGPTIAGHYNLRVFNQAASDEIMGAVTFLAPEDYENHYRKKDVIAAGGSEHECDRTTLFAVRKCASMAYESLEDQGYVQENIRVLAPYADWDLNDVGLANDVDDF